MGGNMSVDELLCTLKLRGIRLEARCDRLRFKPRDRVTPELLQQMKRHKEALLEITNRRLHLIASSEAVVDHATVVRWDDDFSLEEYLKVEREAVQQVENNPNDAWDDDYSFPPSDVPWHATCLACNSIDIWRTGKGAIVCRTCKSIAYGQERVDEIVWWGQLSPDQQAELMPRPIKKPCPWCKRTEHTDICNELRWRTPMPFGKYKGRPIDDLPPDYVLWLAKKKVRLPEDLLNEIYDTFGIVIHPN